jgi:catechol 2,3-dioxygenase-like lactoylglutathione lyase family enzyme
MASTKRREVKPVFDQFQSVAMLPASDIERAKRWYQEKLGLTPSREDEGGLEFQTGGGTRFGVFPSQFAGTNQATAMGFEVDDLDKVADDLIGKGIEFERFDLPYAKTDERGVAEIGPFRGFWFKDSEGNTLTAYHMA